MVDARLQNFGKLGAISFALTGVNILCIWIAGMLMFAVKEVAPSKEKSTFWTRDIKTARARQKDGDANNHVDMEVMKAGLQDALEKKLYSNDPKYVKRMHRHRPRSGNFSFNLSEEFSDMDDDDYLEYFMLGLDPIIEGGEEDRAAYLGFDADRQDFVEEKSGLFSRFF